LDAPGVKDVRWPQVDQREGMGQKRPRKILAEKAVRGAELRHAAADDGGALELPQPYTFVHIKLHVRQYLRDASILDPKISKSEGIRPHRMLFIHSPRRPKLY
jgi:hypothetical protein